MRETNCSGSRSRETVGVMTDTENYNVNNDYGVTVDEMVGLLGGDGTPPPPLMG